jgi:hypothetical protein
MNDLDRRLAELWPRDVWCVGDRCADNAEGIVCVVVRVGTHKVEVCPLTPLRGVGWVYPADLTPIRTTDECMAELRRRGWEPYQHHFSKGKAAWCKPRACWYWHKDYRGAEGHGDTNADAIKDALIKAIECEQ